MLLAFTDDLESAWGDARVAGVLQIWWYAVYELVTVALPGQCSNPCVLVPALSFTLSFVTQSAELWMGRHQAHQLEYPPLADLAILVIFPSLLNAVVGLIVTRFYACSPITLLQLD
jgi:hypothetical protein